MLCACAGMVEVVRVVPSVQVFPNTMENADEPPDDAVPVTTRSALSLCVFDFVHPVGAFVCTNNMAVPAGNDEPPPPAPVSPLSPVRVNSKWNTSLFEMAPDV